MIIKNKAENKKNVQLARLLRDFITKERATQEQYHQDATKTIQKVLTKTKDDYNNTLLWVEELFEKEKKWEEEKKKLEAKDKLNKEKLEALEKQL